MQEYETPELVEIGSVADFTRADQLAFANDGTFAHRDLPPTS